METVEKTSIVQLVNNENIIGVVSNTDETSITIEYPMSLMLDPMSGGLGMIPYLSIYTGTLTDVKTFYKKHIIDILDSTEINKDIIEKYDDYKNQVLNDLKENDVTEQPTLPGLED